MVSGVPHAPAAVPLRKVQPATSEQKAWRAPELRLDGLEGSKFPYPCRWSNPDHQSYRLLTTGNEQSLTPILKHRNEMQCQSVPEEFPVNSFFGRTGPANKHNRSNLAVCRADGQANLWGQQNCKCSTYLYREPSESRNITALETKPKPNQITHQPTAHLMWYSIPLQKIQTQSLYSFPPLTPQVRHHLLDHVITSPYSIIRLAEIDTDLCHLRWTTDSSLQGCDAVLLAAADDSNNHRAFIFRVKQSEKTARPQRRWFGSMQSQTHPTTWLHTPQHSWDSIKSCIMWHNWRKCQIYSFGHYKPHEKVSHLQTFHSRKLQDFVTLQHTSVMRTQRVAGHTAGRELTCACKIGIQNP